MQPICANCGIVISWQPTIVDGRTYCCPGCAMGGPCTCDYSNLPRLGEFRAMVRHTTVIVLPPPSAEGSPLPAQSRPVAKRAEAKEHRHPTGAKS